MFRSSAKSRLVRMLSASPRRFRPGLHPLEERTLLSTLVVTSPADSGPGTLRDRVAVAVSGDTIRFDHSLTNQTITLTSGPVVDVGKSLTITGLGAQHLTISGGGKSSILIFAQDTANGGPSLDVSVSDVTLANGAATQGSGGAIYSFGANLTLTRDVVRDSSAAGFGGGVDAETANPFNPIPPFNTVTIVDSQFLNNTASGGGAYQSYGVIASISGSTFQGNTGQFLGGGVLLGNGSLSVTSSTFRDNVGGGLVLFSGGAPNSPGLTVEGSTFIGNTRSNGLGGAIQDNGGPATITNSTFSNNSTSDPNFAEGGAVSITSAAATVDGCTFTGNVAGTATSQLGRGGGLFIEDSAIVNVTNSTFIGNTATGIDASGGGASQSFAFGYFNQPPTSVFSGNTFTNNRAVAIGNFVTGGGLNLSGMMGPVTVANSTFTGNQATFFNSRTQQNGAIWGGGLSATASFTIFSVQPALTISGTSFLANVARAGSGVTGGNAEGGAIFLLGFASTTVTGGSFLDNSAVAGDKLQPGGYYGLAYGGAIRLLYGGALTISGVLFAGNSAKAGNGNNGADGGIAAGGAISGGVGLLSNSRFVGNTAVGGRGGDAVGSAAGGNGGTAFGGAIDGLGGPATNVIFSANSVTGGNGGAGSGAGAGGAGGDAGGGALTVGIGTISQGFFLANSAVGGKGGKGGVTGGGGAGGNASGGAIYSNPGDGAGGLVVTDSFFTLNFSVGGVGGSGTTRGATGRGLGGAIAILSGVGSIKRSRFLLNHASTDGNDIYGPYTP